MFNYTYRYTCHIHRAPPSARVRTRRCAQESERQSGVGESPRLPHRPPLMTGFQTGSGQMLVLVFTSAINTKHFATFLPPQGSPVFGLRSCPCPLPDLFPPQRPPEWPSQPVS